VTFFLSKPVKGERRDFPDQLNPSIPNSSTRRKRI
jgi:hypothetical protein